MKNLTNSFIPLLLLVSLGINLDVQTPSCSYADPAIPVKVTELVMPNRHYAWIKSEDDQSLEESMVINNQEEYTRYIATSSDRIRPRINFERYTLLAGRFVHPSCGSILDQRVERTCDLYIYTVTLADGNCGAALNVNHFILIEKTDLPVVFRVLLKS